MVAEVQNIEDQNTSIDLLMPQWTLEWHDPRTLLTDKNSREITPDAKMVKSVAKVGVLQPIIAVRTAEGESRFWVRDAEGVAQPQVVDGQTRVRYGEGRTLASIDAARDLVPVIVTGPEGDSDAEEIARLIRQRDENTYRQGMTAREHANTAYQLSLYGVAEADIAEEMQLQRQEVRAAKKLAKSQTGLSLLDDNDGLDLITAAKIAEFEDNPNRVDQLRHLLRNGWDIDQQIRKYKATDKKNAAIAKVWAELESQGLRVTDRRVSYYRADPVRYVTDLRDENGESLTVEQHTECPGHALAIEEVQYYKAPDGTLTSDIDVLPEDQRDDAEPEEERLEGVAVCDQANELHPGPNAPARTEEEQLTAEEIEQRAAERKEAESAERRRVREGNKEWDAAEEGRRKYAKALVQRKTLPAGAMEFLTSELLLAQSALADSFRDGHPMAADWLGVEPGNDVQFAWETRPAPRRTELRQQSEEVNDKRRAVLLLAVVLAANEKALNRHSWRHEGGCGQQNYFRFLIDQGYPACGVERLAAGLPEGPDEAAPASATDEGTAEEIPAA